MYTCTNLQSWRGGGPGGSAKRYQLVCSVDGGLGKSVTSAVRKVNSGTGQQVLCWVMDGAERNGDRDEPYFVLTSAASTKLGWDSAAPAGFEEDGRWS